MLEASQLNPWIAWISCSLLAVALFVLTKGGKIPEMTLQAMGSFFFDILEATALPPTQVGVWIPKAKMGTKVDNFRPLGMPNTLDR